MQSGRTTDGPGIRTVVFLKGCPLRCAWCHNPESQRLESEILFRREKCVLCGRCEAACPNGCHKIAPGGHVFDRAACTACGACAKLDCGALERAGRDVDAEDIIRDVVKDRPFFIRSGGGITLSGGEPLFQPDFCLQLLKLAKAEGLHTCVDTCGYARPELFAAVAEYTDLFLFDYKEADPALHRRFTGVDNGLILENLALLDRLGKSVVLRCPIIFGCNDREDHLAAIAETANGLHSLVRIDLEPYHCLGEGKYALLGMQQHPEFPERDNVAEQIEYIRQRVNVPVGRA